MSTPEHFLMVRRALAPRPYLFTECGLDDIYLLNGYTIEPHDGEDYVRIENLDGLWKAIGLSLVTNRKVLSPKEIKFLRSHMDKTQSELATFLRVDDQTVARWEKGKARLPGPADLALRALFLASEIAQPEGGKILADWLKVVRSLVERDQPIKDDLLFSRGAKGWRSQEKMAA